MTRFLGIDIGTTSTEAVVFGVEQGLVTQAARPTTLYSEG